VINSGLSDYVYKFPRDIDQKRVFLNTRSQKKYFVDRNSANGKLLYIL